MLKEQLPPTKAEECNNIAEILRELAAQLRFDDHRDLLLKLADALDQQAAQYSGGEEPRQ